MEGYLYFCVFMILRDIIKYCNVIRCLVFGIGVKGWVFRGFFCFVVFCFYV